MTYPTHDYAREQRLRGAAQSLYEALKRLEQFTFFERWGAKGLDDEAETIRASKSSPR